MTSLEMKSQWIGISGALTGRFPDYLWMSRERETSWFIVAREGANVAQYPTYMLTAGVSGHSCHCFVVKSG